MAPDSLDYAVHFRDADDVLEIRRVACLASAIGVLISGLRPNIVGASVYRYEDDLTYTMVLVYHTDGVYS